MLFFSGFFSLISIFIVFFDYFLRNQSVSTSFSCFLTFLFVCFSFLVFLIIDFIIVACIEAKNDFKHENDVNDGVKCVPRVIEKEDLMTFMCIKPIKCKPERRHEASNYQSQSSYYKPDRYKFLVRIKKPSFSDLTSYVFFFFFELSSIGFLY